MRRYLKRLAGACPALAFVLFTSSAYSQDAAVVTDDDLAWFSDRSSVKYRLHDAIGLEPALFDAVEGGGGADEVIARFAASIGADTTDASRYAHALIAAMRQDHECAVALNNCRDCSAERAMCSISAHPELAHEVRDVGVAEPTGGLLVSMGMNLFGGPFGELVREATLEHDERGTILAALTDFTGDFTYLAWALAEHDVELGSFQAALREPFEHTPDEVIASLLTARWRTEGAPQDIRAAASAALIYQLLQHGMNLEALAVLDELPDAERSMLTSPDSAIFRNAGGLAARCMAYSAGACLGTRGDASAHRVFFDFGLSLAAAQVAEGRREEAADLVDALRALGEPEDALQLRQLGLIGEIVSPALADAEVFDAFVFGYPRGQATPDWTKDRSVEGAFQFVSGWLAQAQAGPPGLRLATADYLRARGHAEMAEFVLTSSPYGTYLFQDSPRRFPDALVERFGDVFFDARRWADAGRLRAAQEYGAHRGLTRPAEERAAAARGTLEANFGSFAEVSPVPAPDEVDWLFDDPFDDAVAVIDAGQYGASSVLLELTDDGVKETSLGGWVF